VGRSVATDLFREFADAHVRGEEPRARDYIERAGGDRELLASMIDRFLSSTPPRPAASEDERLLDEWLAEPALLSARTRRGIRRGAVVDRLIAELDLDPAQRSRVQEYYHRLETGLLDADRVDRRVYDVLGRVLETAARELARWRPSAGVALAQAYYRLDAEPGPAIPAASAPSDPQPDEIDRLFAGAE
jgi:hypothetical protein